MSGIGALEHEGLRARIILWMDGECYNNRVDNPVLQAISAMLAEVGIRHHMGVSCIYIGVGPSDSEITNVVTLSDGMVKVHFYLGSDLVSSHLFSVDLKDPDGGLPVLRKAFEEMKAGMHSRAKL
jgi:hypothetical protein